MWCTSRTTTCRISALVAVPERGASVAVDGSAMNAGVHCLNNLLQATQGHARYSQTLVTMLIWGLDLGSWLHSALCCNGVMGGRHSAWWGDDLMLQPHFAYSEGSGFWARRLGRDRSALGSAGPLTSERGFSESPRLLCKMSLWSRFESLILSCTTTPLRSSPSTLRR